MAKYATLKAAVQAAIKTNGEQQITGQVLQTQLVNMITSLGKYFQSFGGLATPAGSFSAGDESVTFLAVEAGTYTNFGGAVLDGKTLHILAYDGDWADVDTLIPSGAAFEAALALAIKGSHSGIAEGIADTISAGTAQEFLQRQSGGDGVNCIKRIKGVTKAINQLADELVEYSGNGITITTGRNGYIKINGTATGLVGYSIAAGFQNLRGHRALMGTINPLPAGASWSGNYNPDKRALSIVDLSATYDGYLSISITEGTTFNNYEAYFQCVDLTLAGFADYTLAQILALYPNGFGAYNAGVLKSNDAAALLTNGRNQWDEVAESGYYSDADASPIASDQFVRSKNPIKVFPSTSYYYKNGSSTNTRYLFLDGEKNLISSETGTNKVITTPSNCAYILFYWLGTTYANDICINLSDSSFNGTYEPYWQRVLALRLSELTGIPEGGTEADRVTMFPNGLGGAGSAFDSIFVQNGVTKARRTMLAEIDLGDGDWQSGESGGKTFFYRTITDMASTNPLLSLICSKYTTTRPTAEYLLAGDKNIGSANKVLYVYDSAYTDAATFKAAVAGVKLIAEAATPIVYTDLQYADGTPFTMPATILVDNGGTERIQAPEGATTPSAPFCCDSNYSIGVANLVKRLAALENAE